MSSDTIEFAPLNHSVGIEECDDVGGRNDEPCRVRRQWPEEAIRERLRNGESLWREGDQLTFAYEGQAEAVMLAGGLQLPLSPLRGTDLWVATVRIPRIDSALVSYVFLPQGEGTLPPPPVVRTWRGPDAPQLPVRSPTLQGRIVTDTVESRFLPEPRAVTVYIPHGDSAAGFEGVVYMGDGAAVSGLAAVLDPLVAEGHVPRILLVGAHAAARLPDGGPLADVRALEYLYDYGETYEADDSRFQAHARFFAEELVAWAERRWKAPSDPARRAVLGISNSGAMALQMGVRRADAFGHVIALSPAGSTPSALPETRSSAAASFLISGGLLEPTLHRTALGWAELLAANGLRVEMDEPVAGHDPNSWAIQLPGALLRTLGRDTNLFR